MGLAGTGVATQAQNPPQTSPTVSNRLQQLRNPNNPPSMPPLEVPGEVVVRLAAGATSQDAHTLAGQLGGQVKRKLRFAPNTYVFQNVQAPLSQAVQQLNTSPAVLRATPNQVFRPAALPPAEPNDPLYPQQWALQTINAPNFWGITVGQRLVNGPKKTAVVALLDSGPQISHPDLTENFDSTNAWDFILDQPYDETAANQGFFDSHGTSVAGCIAPLTNNAEGIAGLPWEGVKILPCRVADSFGTGTLNAGIPVSAVVDAVYYSIDQQVDVINMSFGLNNTDPLVQQAIRDAYNQGIVPVASSGDGFFFSRAVEFPATMAETIAVAAVGPSGEPAAYSNSGSQVDIAAPGGNDSNFNDITRQLVLTFPTDFFSGPIFGFPVGYNIDQGTSFSAGYVSGALATLITQGAGGDLEGAERVEALRSLLETTARNPFGRRTPELGAGILDVDNALRQITQFADVIAPEPNEVTASVSEPLVARVVLPTPRPLDEADFEVYRTEEGEQVLVEATVTDPLSGFIRYEPDADDVYVTGVNSFDIVTMNPTGDPDLARSLAGDAVIGPGVNIPARALRFRVSPRIVYPGLRTFAIPYELSEDANTLTYLLGGNEGRLARWLPEENRYAVFDPFGGAQDPAADLTTDNAGVATPPIGIGFWLRVFPIEGLPTPPGQPPADPNAQPLRLQIRGSSSRSGFYSIPLKPGFNLVGTPYTFRVPFNVVNVRFGNEVMSVTEAARRNLIRNIIWRYENGRYTFRTLPQGEFIPWEAHWIQSLANVTLIIPRVGSDLGQTGGVAAANTPAAATHKGGWQSSLRVSAAGQIRGEVTLGQTKAANPLNRLELPPAPAGAEDLRIRGARGRRLAQDLRPASRKSETWVVEYETSRPGEAVKLTWDQFPKGTKVRLEVEGASRSLDLGQRSSLTFTPTGKGVQTLRLTIAPGQTRFG